MTSDDVRSTRFELVKRGYSPEEVDYFIQQVARDIDAMQAEIDSFYAEKEEQQRKIMVLAEKVEEYRGEEDVLKTALINAQRMGETVVYEAKQKAEQIIREANGKTEMLRQQADQEIKNERFMLEKLKEEVSRFKTTVLSLYKQHIESFSALDAPVLRVEEFLAEYYPGEGAAEPEQPPQAQNYANEEPELPAYDYSQQQGYEGDAYAQQPIDGQPQYAPQYPAEPYAEEQYEDGEYPPAQNTAYPEGRPGLFENVETMDIDE